MLIYIFAVNSCIVVGTVCNVSKYLESDLIVILKSLSIFKIVKVFLVESDSTDSTNEIMESIRTKNSNFTYVSLGNLSDQTTNRIERIRLSRNEYVRYIRSMNPVDLPDFVVVADLDGMNSKLNELAIQSCFLRQDWDAVFSNQLGGYYDILALRHPIWQPIDYNKELEWYRSLVVPRRSHFPKFYESLRLRINYDEARDRAIYQKMLRLKHSHPWIPVDSAFGGLGIYRTEIFLDYDYSIVDKSDEGISEHVALHMKMRQDGLKLFINPSLVNANWNTYNLNRYFLIRQFRQLIWNSILISNIFRYLRKLFKKR